MKTTPKSSQLSARFSDLIPMLVVQLKATQNGLKASDLAILLGGTPQHIYKMAARIRRSTCLG
jgi:hypothetical protein